eukprot:3618499-Rhodomonas_salina.4
MLSGTGECWAGLGLSHEATAACGAGSGRSLSREARETLGWSTRGWSAAGWPGLWLARGALAVCVSSSRAYALARNGWCASCDSGGLERRSATLRSPPS